MIGMILGAANRYQDLVFFLGLAAVGAGVWNSNFVTESGKSVGVTAACLGTALFCVLLLSQVASAN
jgi:hypothetical protein